MRPVISDYPMRATNTIEGDLTAAGLKFALVVSRFNSFVTDRLLAGALDAILRSRGPDRHRDGEPAAQAADVKIMARHRSREHALQLIFQWDLRHIPHEEILRGYSGSLLISEDTIAPPRPDPFAEDLFRGVTENLS